MTSCTRTAWRGSAAARSATAGSASASPIPSPTSRCWRAARARPGSARCADPDELVRTPASDAIETVEAGGVALVDVRVEPGYATEHGLGIAQRG